MEEFFKKIIKDIESRIELIRRSIHEDIEEILRRFGEVREEPMWSHEGYLEPLISVRSDKVGYLITINIPLANVNTLSVDIKGNRMILRCALSRNVSFSRWSGTQRNIVFKEYYKEINLPNDADVSKLKIKRMKDMVLIRIPRK